jgi:Ca2+-binding EF-hand superfamily protein
VDHSYNSCHRHFDPNGSGWVDFGEFTWAFFNRRSLVRQWKRSLQGLTEEQIEARFRAADINGDDKLNFREFDKMLNSFGVSLTPVEREQLFQRFDVDNNGSLDLEEFVKFVREEQEHLHLHASKKISDQAHERKWNNSVTYKVDIAQIAREQGKREKTKQERAAKRDTRSMSPPLSARARSRERFFGEGAGSNQTSQQRLTRPSSADVRRITRPKSPGPVFARPQHVRPPSPRYSFRPTIATDNYVRPPPPFDESWLPSRRQLTATAPAATDAASRVHQRPMYDTEDSKVPRRGKTNSRAALLLATSSSPTSSPSSSPTHAERKQPESDVQRHQRDSAGANDDDEFGRDGYHVSPVEDGVESDDPSSDAPGQRTYPDRKVGSSKRHAGLSERRGQSLVIQPTSSEYDREQTEALGGSTDKSTNEWVLAALQKQAELERKLGPAYYSTA